jgi:hypothetical protein
MHMYVASAFLKARLQFCDMGVSQLQIEVQ